MNTDDMAFLTAVWMGDGYITTSRSYPVLKLCHGQKQQAYLEWKVWRINTILGSDVVTRQINNNGYVGYAAAFSSVKLQWLLETAKAGKWTAANVRRLTAEALAVLWMDDGCLAVKMRNGRRHGLEGFLSTYAPQRENEDFVAALNARFGLRFTSVKDRKAYRCRTGLDGLRRLYPIILPYMHSDMFYKIDLSRKSNDRVARHLVYSDKVPIREHEAATP